MRPQGHGVMAPGLTCPVCREVTVPGPTQAWEEGCLLITHRFLLVPV